MSMHRRDFLKVASTGLAAVAVGSAGGFNLFWRNGEAMASTTELELSMVAADHEMTDTVLVPVWAFQRAGDVPRVPGVTIFAVEGDEVRLRVTNSLTVGHSFFIPGVVDSGNIAPGNTENVRFTAPAAGTYLYYDNGNPPMNRVMGLHGAMVVLPRLPLTPYSTPTANVSALFGDFGDSDHFPGSPWDPDRTWIWLVNSVDPDKNAAAAASPGMSGSAFATNYVPQYFTISGKAGFFASHDHHISPHGHVGQPALVRCLNAGLVTHSMHLHGNHVYVLAESDQGGGGVPSVKGNLWLVDVWALPPLVGKDVIIPFLRPPDIPEGTWQRMVAGTSDEVFPLDYPMHCHTEPSQTASGANYPNGLLAHLLIEGPFTPATDGVILARKAELMLKFGKMSISGTSSQPAGTVLEIRAGASAAGPVVGTTQVAGDGSWSFRGRAIRALPSRALSVTTQGGGPQRLDIRPTIR